jgi:hypothetical protein
MPVSAGIAGNVPLTPRPLPEGEGLGVRVGVAQAGQWGYLPDDCHIIRVTLSHAGVGGDCFNQR